MKQHKRASASGQNPAVHLHPRDRVQPFEDGNVNIFARGDVWFEKDNIQLDLMYSATGKCMWVQRHQTEGVLRNKMFE